MKAKARMFSFRDKIGIKFFYGIIQGESVW